VVHTGVDGWVVLRCEREGGFNTSECASQMRKIWEFRDGKHFAFFLWLECADVLDA
jgi:hypothetical protein